ncbi:MAG: tetratricopeptide repeat protein, partial [Rhodospirillaceae bacterium]|nr:tetratricopeptide repeat protein [Rhodospirillaceae bacterium]
APHDARGHFNLGRCLLEAKRPADAHAALTKAARIAPADAAVRIALADACADLDQPHAALDHITAALKIEPTSTIALDRLPTILIGVGRLDDAQAAFAGIEARAKPERIRGFYTECGNGLRKANRFTEALAAYERALAADDTLGGRAGAERAAILHNMAEAHASLGRLDAAIPLAEQAVAAAPDDPRLAYNLGLFELKAGKLGRAWDLFEHRFYSDASARETFKKRYPEPPPYWAGEDLSGKSIVVWREQGLGDEIMGAGALPDLFARAQACKFVCNPRLAAVHRRSFPGLELVPDADLQNLTSLNVDYQVPLGSLGRFFRRDLALFPRHAGYLKADPAKVARVQAKYRAMAAGRPRVGISWRSKNELLGAIKSAGLAAWAPILSAPDAWFVNLQYGDVAKDLAEINTQPGIAVYNDPEIDSGGDLDDFFAQVAALDLVISTSNTTVHVAGALNVPTWLLLPHGAGTLWYWFERRADSPWYPSLRLYRQDPAASPEHEWWSGPVARAAADVRAWAGAASPAAEARHA